MINKHSDWELGAYLYEYNGGTYSSVSIAQPINLLSKTFFSNLTKAYINNKFFYYDLSKDTYFLKCNVEIILRCFITLRTDINNAVFFMTGYYPNPLQLKTIGIPDLSTNTTGGSPNTLKTGIYNTNIPNWIVDKNSTFFFATSNTDSVTFINNTYSFFWTLMLRQI